jgi:hypothetical protein
MAQKPVRILLLTQWPVAKSCLARRPAQPTETIAKSDIMRLALIIIWQFFNIVNMGIILSEWKGWSQETRSSKAWIIAGTIQTVISFVVVSICTRVWLEIRKNDKQRD